MLTITPKFFKDLISSSSSLVPNAKPVPRIGPISGAISMAPIITAGEFKLRPMDAMKIEQIRM